MILNITLTYDNILKGVKMESSFLASRRADEKLPFDKLVFDEEYNILFTTLFRDAQVNVISACTSYLDGTYEYFDNSEFDESNFNLELTGDFLPQVVKSIEIKMREYLVAYIMYRWLETKMQEAQIYYQRAETHLQDMKRFLEMRTSRKIKNNSPW